MMTAVSKVGRQDPAHAGLRSKLDKSIIQPQLTVFSPLLYTPKLLLNKTAVPKTSKPFELESHSCTHATLLEIPTGSPVSCI